MPMRLAYGRRVTDPNSAPNFQGSLEFFFTVLSIPRRSRLAENAKLSQAVKAVSQGMFI
jgi:hypothetical protein